MMIDQKEKICMDVLYDTLLQLLSQDSQSPIPFSTLMQVLLQITKETEADLRKVLHANLVNT